MFSSISPRAVLEAAAAAATVTAGGVCINRSFTNRYADVTPFVIHSLPQPRVFPARPRTPRPSVGPCKR